MTIPLPLEGNSPKLPGSRHTVKFFNQPKGFRRNFFAFRLLSMDFTRNYAYPRVPAAGNKSTRGHEPTEEQSANGKDETDEQKREEELREMQR